MSFGVYIHLPYCLSICPYCDFNSYVDPRAPWDRLTSAIVAELRTRAPAFGSGGASTLYFGGGTPSLAPVDTVGTLIDTVRAEIGLRADAEITLETNPGRIDARKLAGFRERGVNRLSLGWQSTHDHLLRVLGRGHSAADSHDAYVAGREAGFDNMSVDLIFAVPGQTRADLHADLARLRALSPEHISLYALTYKPNTPFAKRRDQGRLVPVSEDIELEMMQIIEQVLCAEGYEHYEVSNYAKPGRVAVHNSLYWQGGRYLGVGPGAHSFHHDNWQRGWRWESVRDPRAYIQAWAEAAGHSSTMSLAPADCRAALPLPNDPRVSFVETLTARQLFSERMLCGLRQASGLDTSETICAAHPQALAEGTAAAVARGWGEQVGTHLRPTARGLENADALAALFF